MNSFKKLALITIFSLLLLNSCSGGKIWDPAPASEVPHSADERVRKNIEEGKGIKLLRTGESAGGTVMFASANPLWKATMDTLDFMILSSADYGGGIIITDWYSDGSSDEAIKISIRFLTNEVRSDALNIKVFYKKCRDIINCKITEKTGNLVTELKKKILNKAAVYQKQNKDKNFKPYKGNITAQKD